MTILKDIILIAIVGGGWLFIILGNAWVKGLFFNMTIGRKGNNIKTGLGLTYLEMKMKEIEKEIKDEDPK